MKNKNVILKVIITIIITILYVFLNNSNVSLAEATLLKEKIELNSSVLHKENGFYCLTRSVKFLQGRYLNGVRTTDHNYYEKWGTYVITSESDKSEEEKKMAYVLYNDDSGCSNKKGAQHYIWKHTDIANKGLKLPPGVTVTPGRSVYSCAKMEDAVNDYIKEDTKAEINLGNRFRKFNCNRKK